jgi:chromate transporter
MGLDHIAQGFQVALDEAGDDLAFEAAVFALLDDPLADDEFHQNSFAHQAVSWARLNDEKSTLCFALGRLTPGTNLLAFCTGVGWLLRGAVGALVALLAASIPCAVMVIVLTALFRQWQDNGIAQAAIHGAVAAAVAITAKTSGTVARPIYKSGAHLRVALTGAAAFGLYVVLGVPAIYILLLAGLIGAFLPATES